MNGKIYVIIPAFNEAGHIGKVIKKTYEALPKAEVIVIDDGSTDNTKVNAIKSGARVISHVVNFGKGKAITDAWFYLMNAYDLKPDDLIVHLDADGQHEPENIKHLIELMEHFDMVVGKRDFSIYPLYKKFGNKVLSLWASLLSGQKIEDSESGFRCFTYLVMLDLIRTINPQRYEVEMEINVAAAMLKNKIGFVNVSSRVYRKQVGVMSGIKSFYSGLKTFIKIRSNWLKWK